MSTQEDREWDAHQDRIADDQNRREEEPDGAPCCPDPDCSGSPCTFPGYASNH